MRKYKSQDVATHNPRAAAINHAMWLMLTAGLTIELALASGSTSFWYSLLWVAIGLSLFPAAMYCKIETLRTLLAADALTALIIFSFFMIQGPALMFAMGILAGQIAFAVYLSYLAHRQILEYRRMEILHDEY